MASAPDNTPGANAELDTKTPSRQSASSSDAAIEKKESSAAEVAPIKHTQNGVSDPEKVELQKLDSRVVVEDEDDKDKDPFAHLPPHEAEILKRQIESPDNKVTYFTLFRYATKLDLVIFAISMLCSIAAGAALPLMTVIFGGLTGTFADYFQGKMSYAKYEDKLIEMILYFIYLGVAEFVTTYIYIVGFIYVGEHQTQMIREEYLKAMLRQNVGYFDNLGSGEMTTRITADTNIIQDGISEKLGLTVNAFATFVAAIVIGFIFSWRLTLILFAGVIGIVLAMGIGGSMMVKWTAESQEEYAKGGTVAEEVLSSIRNASAFNTQEKLSRQYDTFLHRAEMSGRKVQGALGTMLAMMMMIINLLNALAFWEGSRMLVRGQLTVSDLLTVTFSLIIGAFNIGNVATHIKNIVGAVGAGVKIFSTIERDSPINPESTEGIKLDDLVGTIELQDIKHIYPSRPEVVVMEGANLVVPAGKQTALVGASGSGKSTIVGLVERFYDPVGGRVLLDGRDIKEYNIQWLREHISLVQQEPVLFSTTIYENIRYGLLGPRWANISEEKQREMILDAAKMANAHDFITNLPDGYETNVGARGFLLSGGQKQRIAIARAVVCDPRILLLDEATSALDTKSEGIVQAALDKASEGRTTISIAHRLSTIKNADNIVVMTKGKIVEQGTHDNLLDRRGAYFNLVEAQRIAAEKESTDVVESEEEVLQERGAPVDPDDLNPAKLTKTQTGKSQSSIILAQKAQEKQKKYTLWQLIKFIWSFQRKELWMAFVGFLFAVICGGSQPAQSVLFAKSVQAISFPPERYNDLRREINFYAWFYFMLGMVLLIAHACDAWFLGYCQEVIIHRARLAAFRSLLRQDIAYFDRDENTSGALTSFLSTSIIDIAGLSGTTLATILMVSTTLVAGLILSLIIGWKLTLVCVGTIPVLIACGYFRFSMLARFAARSKSAYENSASWACENTAAIRTVASLTRESEVREVYHKQMESQAKTSLRSVLFSSTLFAGSQSLVFFCLALGFWYGGTLIGKYEYSMFQFFVCFQCIIFGSQSVGTIFSFAPDMGKAKNSATRLKDLFDRVPSIEPWSKEGEELKTMGGYIEFRDVHFRYPTRPDQPVLRGLNLSVKPGQYVALVGASGCGKSTTIQLMERFYDALSGSVLVDGKDISKLHLNTYRNHLALVSQEPTLYQGTIRDNILLGADREDVPDEEVVKVCQDANIYDFIMSLPDGFNTPCGSKGTMLSGGQKQRIAIARALLRNPKILLLDEATSALDSESERVVQAALDAAARGRTTIAVAHRLSTIQKADIIYVIDNGKVVESGTHNDLLSKKGRYAELVTLQSLEKQT